MLSVQGSFDYTTKDGDTWDSIALDFYGDETFMTYIIQFNHAYSDYLVFPEGIELEIPYLEGEEDSDTLPPWRNENDSSDQLPDLDENGTEFFDYELGDNVEDGDSENESDD